MIDPVLREFPELDADGVAHAREPDRPLRDRRARRPTRASPAARSSSTPTAAWRRTAAAASRARTRRRSTAPPPTWRATSRRTSSRPGSPTGCQLQVAYAIGTAHPVSLMVDTFGTEHVDPAKLVRRRAGSSSTSGPAAIIRDLDLRRPIYRETAAYGHFGRKEFPWEATDRADELRARLRLARRRSTGPGRGLRRPPAPRRSTARSPTPARGARARASARWSRCRSTASSCAGGCSGRPRTCPTRMLAGEEGRLAGAVLRRRDAGAARDG